ncbi:hypothetical protein KKG66_00675, partial [bacterium]|nr:hypothetical protein [bacterium]
MKKVLTICTVLVALCCLVVYAGNGITVVDRGNVETKAAPVTKAETEVIKTEVVKAETMSAEEQEELARKAAEAAAWETPGELESLWQNVLAAKRSGNLDAFKQAITAYEAAEERLGRPGSGTLDACNDCATPNTYLVFPTTVWAASVSGDCATEGKWYAEFAGVAGATYHFDLCTVGSSASDLDIKICDATCAILAGVDGSSSCNWNPSDFQWTCTTAGTYYAVLAPYSSYSSHTCGGDETDTFEMFYYMEEPPSAFACCYDDHGVNVCAEVEDEDACDLLGGTFYPGLGCDDVWCCNP